MKRLDIDNPFFRAMSVLADVIFLSVLWIVCCVPVVTAGAGTLALYAVAGKIAAGQSYRVLHDFLHAFRRDFRQATAVWLPMLLLALVLGFDVFLAGRLAPPWGGLLLMVTVAGWLLWVAALNWGMALLARFAYARGRDTVKNGLAMTVRHPLATLAVTALILCPAALLLFLPDVFLYLLPLFVLGWPGGCALVLARAARPTFAKMEEERGFSPDSPEENDGGLP